MLASLLSQFSYPLQYSVEFILSTENIASKHKFIFYHSVSLYSRLSEKLTTRYLNCLVNFSERLTFFQDFYYTNSDQFIRLWSKLLENNQDLPEINLRLEHKVEIIKKIDSDTHANWLWQYCRTSKLNFC